MTHDLNKPVQLVAKSGHDPVGNRADPRTELVTQAFVSIPPLKTRAFQVSEISRGGMFLAFKDATTTLIEMEHAGIEKGWSVDIAFAVSSAEKKHRISVRATIARISRHGLGVEFVTHNPPQLAGLRELFPTAFNADHDQAKQSKSTPACSAKTVLDKPLASADWEDWKIEDY